MAILSDNPAFGLMEQFYNQPLSVQDTKELVSNLSGFFGILRDWSVKQPLQLKECCVYNLNRSFYKSSISYLPQKRFKLQASSQRSLRGVAHE